MRSAAGKPESHSPPTPAASIQRAGGAAAETRDAGRDRCSVQHGGGRDCSKTARDQQPAASSVLLPRSTRAWRARGARRRLLALGRLVALHQSPPIEASETQAEANQRRPGTPCYLHRPPPDSVPTAETVSPPGSRASRCALPDDRCSRITAITGGPASRKQPPRAVAPCQRPAVLAKALQAGVAAERAGTPQSALAELARWHAGNSNRTAPSDPYIQIRSRPPAICVRPRESRLGRLVPRSPPSIATPPGVAQHGSLLESCTGPAASSARRSSRTSAPFLAAPDAPLPPPWPPRHHGLTAMPL
ncbi:uncharacterized protein BDZ99DRAFT_515046 [Mytilinidion resinicola]|uniref:Uncharacterized protein n=1 Tax=Mytilinidion resinicola TaxID=574789 RepID=A0A6A6Z6X2_9PEZI|nr:uncharacterized protein BDZ99DRAFT_515046 [Mytilinidion resinicola]KAF2816459.1 hypothetical protein BDZ99DRAFT_515046 [Mytilinidion resinicola]